jgi:hypothetical protein
MKEKELALLEIFYELTYENSRLLPFTEYLDLINEKMHQQTFTILGLYSSLLENNYIKITSQDSLYITEKGLARL